MLVRHQALGVRSAAIATLIQLAELGVGLDVLVLAIPVRVSGDACAAVRVRWNGRVGHRVAALGTVLTRLT